MKDVTLNVTCCLTKCSFHLSGKLALSFINPTLIFSAGRLRTDPPAGTDHNPGSRGCCPAPPCTGTTHRGPQVPHPRAIAPHSPRNIHRSGRRRAESIPRPLYNMVVTCGRVNLVIFSAPSPIPPVPPAGWPFPAPSSSPARTGSLTPSACPPCNWRSRPGALKESRRPAGR